MMAETAVKTPPAVFSYEVGRESQPWQDMKLDWKKIKDLKDGTRQMRLMGELYLPKYEAESPKSYQSRLRRSFLFGAYQDTVRKIASKPFSQKVELTSPPEKLAEIDANIDRTGVDLTSFSQEVFEAAIDFGLTHVLVDYPTVPLGSTLADEERLGARPTFIHVTPEMLIGWRASGTGSELKLTQVRIREEREEDEGQFGRKVTKYIRVYTENSWQLWKATGQQKEGDDQYILVKQGTNTLGFIPLATVYFNKTGFMMGKPALDELAWLNIWHWQSSSDQNNILSFARFGLWFMKGITPEEKKAGIVVGPTRLISSTNEEADMKVVESTGASIQAGERDLRTTEQRMEIMGVQPFVQRSGVETATGKQTHENKQETLIQAWVRRTTELIHKCYHFGGKWTNEKLPEKFRVHIFKDFGVNLRSDVDMRLLLDMSMAGRLTPKSLLEEAKRRSMLSEDFDVNAELKELEKLIDLINEGQQSDGGGGANNDPKPTKDGGENGPAQGQ